MDTLVEPFRIGERLTPDELRTSYTRITGKAFPGQVDKQHVAAALSRCYPMRFAHEVNRLRGFAFDLAPDGTVF